MFDQPPVHSFLKIKIASPVAYTEGALSNLPLPCYIKCQYCFRYSYEFYASLSVFFKSDLPLLITHGSCVQNISYYWKLSFSIILGRQNGVFFFSVNVSEGKLNHNQQMHTVNTNITCIRIPYICFDKPLSSSGGSSKVVQELRINLHVEICALLGYYAALCGSCLPTRCPETSVNSYYTTPCNNPEERRSHQHGARKP
jgi:hypothetical protein